MYSLEDSNDELNLYKKEHKKLLKALPNKEEIPFFIFGVKNDFNEQNLNDEEDKVKRFCQDNDIMFGGFINTTTEVEKEKEETLEILKKNVEEIVGCKIENDKVFTLTDKEPRTDYCTCANS